MLSDLRFGSYLSYNPNPTTDAEREAKNWMHRIKSDLSLKVKRPGGIEQISTMKYLAEWLVKTFSDTPLGEILSSESILVPLPGSGLQKPGSFWGPERLATAMVLSGLGAALDPCVVRHTAVPKSAYARRGERPNPRTHYESFSVEQPDLTEIGSIVLVDDVITRGSTMIAAASRIMEAFPNCKVSGFAMLRTMGYRIPFSQLRDPTVGTITIDNWGKAQREP
jgi:hypothetical protein